MLRGMFDGAPEEDEPAYAVLNKDLELVNVTGVLQSRAVETGHDHLGDLLPERKTLHGAYFRFFAEVLQAFCLPCIHTTDAGIFPASHFYSRVVYWAPFYGVSLTRTNWKSDGQGTTFRFVPCTRAVHS